ncbi:MAG: cobyric acid synthase [Lachnospiraceae bacterium]|nr:cobyric acid synthase [Lachnospiraceae bacterium]
MAKVLMVQGTMSNAGKSLVVAGLCRIFKQDGYRVAPFKSQNMALNSFITKEGLEMGRAQVMQAEAAGIDPMVCMNPILLKPTTDKGSQVIVNGEVLGNMPAKEYFKYKTKLIPDIVKAFQKLEEYADIIVIEGAGSPAEINLKENDIVNMGLAKLVDAPVLLVGDIDRGGVFAQLLGTIMLLEEDEKERIKGLIVNKFRGDKTILDPGITMLEERGGIPVTGVLPYMHIRLDDEDSLSERLTDKGRGVVNIAVIRLPRISNFTDFSAFERIDGVKVTYVTRPAELADADFVILPGSKNTIGDLKWLRESGMEASIYRFAQEKPVMGICGGYQMLGNIISDPESVEEGGSIRGLGLLNMETVLQKQKTTVQVSGSFEKLDGFFSCLSGQTIEGYEIHMGDTRPVESLDQAEAGVKSKEPLTRLQTKRQTDEKTTACMGEVRMDGAVCGDVCGSYVHGIFDHGDIAFTLAKALADKKGVMLKKPQESDYQAYKESQYDLLAAEMRKHMDMDAVYAMLRDSAI